MKNSINIFSETGCIQHEMLWKYRKGTLSAAEKHAVEVHLTDCELCSDALSGMMELETDEMMAGLRESVRKISAPKKVIRFYDYRILSAAAAAAAILVVFYVTNSPDKQHKEEIAQLTAPAPLAPEEPKKNEEIAVADTILVPRASEDILLKEKSYKVTFADSVGSSLSLTYSGAASNADCNTSGYLSTAPNFKAPPEELITEKDITVEDNADVAESAPSEEKPVQSEGNAAPAQTYEWTQSIKEEKTSASTRKKTDSDKLKRNQAESSKIMYINDLKVANTPAMAASEKLDTLNTGSLPPKYENEEQKAAETSIGRELPFVYSKTLRDGMNYFHNKQYNEASQTFGIILERLPNDVNSQFYKGLSEMNVQNYSASTALLNKAMLNTDKTFYEEAKFKLALCYIALNQKGDAEKLLREIKEEKGFYADKASEELQRLK